MAKARHPEDHTLYQKLLEGTRDKDGVVHRDLATKVLAEKLAEDVTRAAEYAQARALEVADGFDNTHKPETEQGQMALDIQDYLIIGESERVRVDVAKASHTRQWLDIQILNKARQDFAHAAKTLHGYKLLAIQDERKCSMWAADQILRGEKKAS